MKSASALESPVANPDHRTANASERVNTYFQQPTKGKYFRDRSWLRQATKHDRLPYCLEQILVFVRTQSARSIPMKTAVAGFLACSAFAQSGHWEGRIQVPGHDLAITVDLATNDRGVWIGSMTVIRTSSVDVPLNNIAIKERAVHFQANLPELASFNGHVSDDGSTISGAATNAQGDAPFEVARIGDPNVKLPAPSSALTADFQGSWEGALEADGKTTRIVLQLSPSENGIAIGAFTLPDQRNMELPLTTVIIQGKKLRLETRSVSGTFEGTLGANGEITGEWSQGPTHFPLAFRRSTPK
jgi:hypothetical protein